MGEVKPLTHEELISPDARFEKVLWPWQIPVHPIVYDSDLVYTPQFIKQVRLGVPESVKQDILAIERLLGKPLEILVHETGMTCQRTFPKELEYEDIWSRVETKRKSIGLELGGTNIDLDIPSRILTSTQHHPMSREKLEQYAFEVEPKLKIHTWHIHNYTDHGVLVELYMRNFAILFNNLGLARLASGKAY